MTGKHRIAFVGLGAMGLPMAINLAKAGHNVRGYDVRSEPMDTLAAAGGIQTKTLIEACTDADMIILMVVNAAQARMVLFEENALNALQPGAYVCLMATCSPEDVVSLARDIEQTGRKLVDCPVSGGIGGATSGTLTIMAGAATEDFHAVADILKVMGDKLFHCGTQVGQGAAVKAINQLLCGVHIAVTGEAMALGEKAGVDTSVLLEILSGSAASSWMLKDRGPRMLMSEPPVASAVDIFVKDLGIALAAGRSSSMALPLAAAAHQMFLAESGAGNGKSDDSQVVQAYRRLNGMK